MMLFPGEFSDAEVRRAWEYYLPLTTHDSSLSAGVHAIVACRLGLMDDAWRFWRKAAATDLDVERGGAAEGIHIANAALLWQTAVFGFAGMHTAMQSDVLTIRPLLPATWTRLAFPIVWKGRRAYVGISRDEVTVTNRSDKPLEVCVGRERRTIAAWDSCACRIPDEEAIRIRLALLTPRERNVFDLVVAGKSNAEIASELGVSEKTVEVHRKHLMRKLRRD
jgi:kojibiose phosphorylase